MVVNVFRPFCSITKHLSCTLIKALDATIKKMAWVCSAFIRPIFEIFSSITGKETPEKMLVISDAVEQTDNFISFNRKTFSKFV